MTKLLNGKFTLHLCIYSKWVLYSSYKICIFHWRKCGNKQVKYIEWVYKYPHNEKMSYSKYRQKISMLGFNESKWYGEGT